MEEEDEEMLGRSPVRLAMPITKPFVVPSVPSKVITAPGVVTVPGNNANYGTI